MDEKIKPIKIVLLDVDGVLTDGTIVLGKNEELKFFNAHDGMAISYVRKVGIKVGIITGRTSEAVKKRAEELHMDFLYQDCKRKLDTLNKILHNEGMEYQHVCFIGDDIIDIPLLKNVGFAATVDDAPDIVKSHADYVSPRPGGRGAVRDVLDYILKTQGTYDTAINALLEEWI
ncbi:MAG: KdsC family phosphatase [bacterium]